MTETEDIWMRVRRVADTLGYNRYTIHKWKSRGYIPPRHHYTLFHQARELDIPLTFTELVHLRQ